MKKCFIIALLFVFLLLPNSAAVGQGITIHGVVPTKGYAHGKVEAKWVMNWFNTGDIPCDRTYDTTVEFWNVGALGGDQFKTATVKYVDNGQLDKNCTWLESDTDTFSGGPNGEFTNIPWANYEMKLVNGHTINLVIKGDKFEISGTLQVTNPEIFDGWTDEEPTATLEGAEPTATSESTGMTCTPSVRGIDPQKPGDVISPGASYSAPDGSEVGIIQERWYINGQETNSATWDGSQTRVELQWTCLDSKGYSQTFDIPAYQAVPSSAPSTNPGGSGLTTGLGIVMLGLGGLAGLGGAVGVGVAIVQAITAGAAPIATVTPAVVTPAITPRPPAVNPPSQSPTRPDPSLKKPWEQKITDLTGQRTAIQEKIQAANQAIDKLTRQYKKNILKVIMKGGLETGQILLDAVSGGAAEAPNIAIELGKKTATDKIMNSVFQAADNSQDGKNVVGLKDLINNLKNQRDGLRSQVKDINHQIQGIQEHIQNNFQ